jgi:hypothetical protein
MNTTYSGNAPGKEDMDRGNTGNDMNDSDSKAVDWWRHRTLGNGSMNVRGKTELDTALSPPTFGNRKGISRQQPPDENNLHSQQPVQGPIQKPYSVPREQPMRPADENVSHPRKVPKEVTKNLIKDVWSSGSHITDERRNGVVVETNPTKLDRNSISRRSQDRRNFVQSSDDQQEHMAFITRVDSADQPESRHPVDPPGTPTRSASLGNMRPQPIAIDESFADKKRKKLPLSKFIEKKSKNKFVMEESSHLSDVPSDVDSVIKERYLLACQMLKTTMIQKEKSLIPIEKEYILSLLGDIEYDGVDSVVSEDHVSAIERATLRLEDNSIFQQPVREKVKLLHDPPALKTRSSMTRDLPMDTAVRVEKSDKNPHTATRKPRNKLLKTVTNACNPNSPRGARGEVSHDVHIVENHQYNDEWDDAEMNDQSRDELVRFDGWSFQRSNEYPFLIFGAEGEDLNPRVLTPAMMEALRGFMPYRVSESNFWLKYSLIRDGASLPTLLANIRGSTYTMIGVETNRGEVFGSFTGTPWRIGGKWFGNGEAFLWRLKKPRYTSPTNSRKPNFEREMEVYPYTGYDDLVQYCTTKTIAVGGGDWIDVPCPFDNDTQGIGFMIDGDLAGGETNSCSTFANPRLAKQTTASSEFTITNLEVWTLTPCINVKDATRMEMQKLFLEEQGAAMMRG